MDIFALLLGLTLAASLLLFIGRPLRQARRSSELEPQLDILLARRESLYTQIRELDFDHATGKITDADHDLLRAQLVDEAAGVLRQIDTLNAAAQGDAALEAAIAGQRRRKDVAAIDAELEAAIAARRKRQFEATSSTDAELEAVIAARRKTLACPNCGKPVNTGDAFCTRCGAALGAQVVR